MALPKLQNDVRARSHAHVRIVDPLRYKTVPCRQLFDLVTNDFRNNVTCKFGPRCQFAHSWTELKPMKANTSSAKDALAKIRSSSEPKVRETERDAAGKLTETPNEHISTQCALCVLEFDPMNDQ